MISLQQLVRLSNAELDRIDIAVKNLACAMGLPGAENIDPDAHLRTIAEWKERVAWKTCKEWRQFQKRPWDFYRSRNYLFGRNCGQVAAMAITHGSIALEVCITPNGIYEENRIGEKSGDWQTFVAP